MIEFFLNSIFLMLQSGSLLCWKREGSRCSGRILWALAQSGSDKTRELLPLSGGRIIDCQDGGCGDEAWVFHQSSRRNTAEDAVEQPEDRFIRLLKLSEPSNPAFYHGLEILTSDPHLQVSSGAQPLDSWGHFSF